MNVFGDYKTEWVKRYPESELHSAWADDVRTNLDKHRTRVVVLREELEKEEFYVKYLENVLLDAEKLRASVKTSTGETVTEPEDDQVISSTVGDDDDDQREDNLKLDSQYLSTSRHSLISFDSKNGLTIDETTDGLDELNRDKSQFVTVIEVNGSKTVTQMMSVDRIECTSTESSPGVRKKVPPKPPPKRPRRPISEQPPLGHKPDLICHAAHISNSTDKAEATDKLLDPVWSSVMPTNCDGNDCGENIHENYTSHDTTEHADVSTDVLCPIKSDEVENGQLIENSSGTCDTLKSQTSGLSYASDSHSVSLDGEIGDASGSSPTSGRATSASLNSVPSVDDDDINDYVNLDYFLKKNHAKKHRDIGESVSTDTDGDDGILEDDEDDVDVDVDVLLASDNEEELLTGTINSDIQTEKEIPVMNTPPLPPKNYGRSKLLLSQQTKIGPSDIVANSGIDLPSKEVPVVGSVVMSECIVSSILESEITYLECLNLLIQYMKALRSTIGTSQPVISQEDLNIIFHKIPELHEMHRLFVEGIRARVKQPRSSNDRLAVGDHFKLLASRLTSYESFLQNYPRAIETIRKCSAENAKFSEITKDIKLKALKGQALTLEDLLHKPVARVQKNAFVIHDLLKHTPESHPDYKALQVALRMTQCFLNEFNMSATESMFPVHDHTPRHLVKNSFVVELTEGRRKLRHLFLFNDVIVSAKYKPSGREKFIYEVKWFVPLQDVVVLLDDANNDADLKENNPFSVFSLKSQVATVRDQIIVDENYSKEKSRVGSRHLHKLHKKLSELQALLVLASPNLVFRIGQKSSSGKSFIFFLSSKFEKSQWTEAITVVQSHAPSPSSTLTLYELQTWITTCRKFLQTNMGSFLLKSGKDDSLVGDLNIVFKSLNGLHKPADMQISFEVDSYGHFFQKGKTNVVCEQDSQMTFERQEFVVELDGAHYLRLICYERINNVDPIILGHATIELNKSWLMGRLQEKTISLQDFTVEMSIKFTQCQVSLRRVPSSKPYSLFGVKISSVAKKEKRSIPFLVMCCVQEVEKRGLPELGLYRVSGSSTDVQKLKRAFESNAYEAEQLVKEMDIHSVTGIFKFYLRELPEGLFTDDLYHKLLDTFGMADGEQKSRELLRLFESLPMVNKDIVLYLIEHMMKINKEEKVNKMSLQNLATVFGPTLIRPSVRLENCGQSDRLASGTIDVMAQAGILYFYLKKRSIGYKLGTTSDSTSV